MIQQGVATTREQFAQWKRNEALSDFEAMLLGIRMLRNQGELSSEEVMVAHRTVIAQTEKRLADAAQ